MRSLKTLIFVCMTAAFVAPAYAYERCQSFQKAELKSRRHEGLDKGDCANEDRLLEVLEAVRWRKGDEGKRDGDACWEALIKLTAQPRFERDGRCPSAVQAGAS